MSADGGPEHRRGPDARRHAGRLQGRARRRPGGARGRDDARRLDLGGRRAQPGPRGRAEGELGEIEVTSEPLVSWAKRHRLLRLPVIRGVVALGESLKIGFRALAISANAQLRRGRGGRAGGDRRLHVGPDDRPLAGARDRALLRHPGRRHEPDQGPARLARCSSGSSRASCGPRSSSATSSRSAACRTCGGCSSTTAPSTRRSPATRPATG